MRSGRSVVVVVVAALASACGSIGAESVSPPSSTVTTTATTTTATTAPPPTSTSTTIAETTTTTLPPASTAGLTSGPVDVYRDRGDDHPFRTLPETTVLGTPTVVSVLDEADGWIEAMLPGRPNGETGWIRADRLEVFTIDREALVDLSDRMLYVYDDGVEVLRTPVAVGNDRSPTPVGTFFVTDAVEVASGRGPWGPYAFGLSARSDVVTEFNGGDGIIGIHGTNQPWSIGEAASLGCVRLPNDVMTKLWEIVAVGMKVTIDA